MFTGPWWITQAFRTPAMGHTQARYRHSTTQAGSSPVVQCRGRDHSCGRPRNGRRRLDQLGGYCRIRVRLRPVDHCLCPLSDRITAAGADVWHPHWISQPRPPLYPVSLTGASFTLTICRWTRPLLPVCCKPRQWPALSLHLPITMLLVPAPWCQWPALSLRLPITMLLVPAPWCQWPALSLRLPITMLLVQAPWCQWPALSLRLPITMLLVQAPWCQWRLRRASQRPPRRCCQQRRQSSRLVLMTLPPLAPLLLTHLDLPVTSLTQPTALQSRVQN